MLVDQRFCPRIVEGELRYNCVGPKLVGIIHKKPKEGRHLGRGRHRLGLHLLRPRRAQVRQPDQQLPHQGHRQDHAGARPGRADPAVVDDRLHPRVAGGHAVGGREVDRGRVQLLVRRHLQVPAGLLQGRLAQCVLGRRPRGGQGGGDVLRQHDGRGGPRHPGQAGPGLARRPHQGRQGDQGHAPAASRPALQDGAAADLRARRAVRRLGQVVQRRPLRLHPVRQRHDQRRHVVPDHPL